MFTNYRLEYLTYNSLGTGHQRVNRWRLALRQASLSSNTRDHVIVEDPRDYTTLYLHALSTFEKDYHDHNGHDHVVEGVEGEIERDVERTFQEKDIFTAGNIGKEMLRRILLALYKTDGGASGVGYCQVRQQPLYFLPHSFTHFSFETWWGKGHELCRGHVNSRWFTYKKDIIP